MAAYVGTCVAHDADTSGPGLSRDSVEQRPLINQPDPGLMELLAVDDNPSIRWSFAYLAYRYHSLGRAPAFLFFELPPLSFIKTLELDFEIESFSDKGWVAATVSTLPPPDEPPLGLAIYVSPGRLVVTQPGGSAWMDIEEPKVGNREWLAACLEKCVQVLLGDSRSKAIVLNNFTAAIGLDVRSMFGSFFFGYTHNCPNRDDMTPFPSGGYPITPTSAAPVVAAKGADEDSDEEQFLSSLDIYLNKYGTKSWMRRTWERAMGKLDTALSRIFSR